MSRGRSRRRESLRLERSSGVLLHPTSLPGGRFGAEARRFVDWLVDAGQSFWQVLPLGPPDAFESPYAGSSAFAGWSGLLADPEARVGASAIAEYRRRHAYWIDDWLEHARRPGRGGDAGAVRAGVDRAAEVRERARGSDHRRSPPVRRTRERGRRGSPGVLRSVARSGRAPGSLHQERAALGKSDVSLARAAAGRLPLVGRALPALPPAVRPHAARSLPRLRLVLGRAVRQPDGEARALAPRPGHGPLRHRPGGARRPARDRGGPRPHHASGPPAPRRARRARDAHPPVGVRRGSSSSRQRWPTTGSTRSSTQARTTTTLLPAGGSRRRPVVVRASRPSAGRRASRRPTPHGSWSS